MPNDQISIRSDLSLGQIDLNLLRVFDVLMEERSVTRTAERICRTQSSVSHSVAKLRLLFNDKLFVREGSVMVPTPWALELAGVISKALSDIGKAVNRNALFDATSSTRNFRIGVSDYTAVAFLPRLVERFAREAPKATLNMIHAREADVPAQLRSREFEAVILGNASYSEAYLAQKVLSTDKIVCAGWRGNPNLKQLTLETYLAAEHLQVSADGIAEGAADPLLRAMNRTRRVVATIPHYLVAPWVIKGTQLITAFGDSMLFTLTDASETVIFPPPLPFPGVAMTLVYERHLESDLGHTWLRKLIESVAEELRLSKDQLYRDFSRLS